MTQTLANPGATQATETLRAAVVTGFGEKWGMEAP